MMPSPLSPMRLRCCQRHAIFFFHAAATLIYYAIIDAFFFSLATPTFFTDAAFDDAA